MLIAVVVLNLLAYICGSWISLACENGKPHLDELSISRIKRDERDGILYAGQASRVERK